MDFSLTETQQMLQDSAVRLMREHYSFNQRADILASPGGQSDEIWKLFADLGLLGVEIDEAHSGSGGNFFDLAVIMEAFGSALVVEPYLPTVVLGAGLLAFVGSDDQMADYLPKIAAGRLKMALAQTEPGARYDLNHVATVAKRSDDGFSLNGKKMAVLGGDVADLFIMPARTSGADQDEGGITLFLVPRDAEGLSIECYPNIDGTGAADLVLDGVIVPADSRLGAEGGGLALIRLAIDRGIAALCSEAVGVMVALNDMTVDYLNTRAQFGRPIGKFQVLQHRMVDMTIAAEQARSMAILASDRMARPMAPEQARDISAAKVQICKSARIVGQGSTQLHGGMGLTMEYAASHFFKRLTAIDITFGNADFHLAQYIALEDGSAA